MHPANRRIIIGAIGGDKQPDRFDFQLGGAVARAGCILLTGGHPSPRAEVKNSAMRGCAFEEATGGGAIARLIGVIPSRLPEDWSGPPPYRLSSASRPSETHKLLLDSEQSHNIRNVINGLTPDVVVAFGGGAGTLAEIAFATAAGRAIFFHNAIDRLRKNLETYFGSHAAKINKITYFDEPLSVYPKIVDKSWTTDELLLLLGQVLRREHDINIGADSLVSQCIDTARKISAVTGFPGIPRKPDSKQQFEQLVQAISQ